MAAAYPTLTLSHSSNDIWTEKMKNAAVSGWRRTDGKSFDLFWREKKMLPLLATIADEPTHNLQKQRLKTILLDETEGQVIHGVINRMSDAEAEAVLIEWPSPEQTGQSVATKRLLLTYEYLFSVLNTVVLLEAGRSYNVDPEEMHDWLDLYSFAHEFMISRRFSIRSMHVSNPEFSAQDSFDAERRAEPMFVDMITLLGSLRDDVTNDRGGVDTYRARFNAMVDARDRQYKEITGREPPPTDERI